MWLHLIFEGISQYDIYTKTEDKLPVPIYFPFKVAPISTCFESNQMVLDFFIYLLQPGNSYFCSWNQRLFADHLCSHMQFASLAPLKGGCQNTDDMYKANLNYSEV